MTARYSINRLSILAVLAFALVLSGFYFVFSAYELPDIPISNPLLGATDLDRFLAETESRFIDLKPGTEKKIIWNNSTQKSKIAYAVVYLHGFSATHQEISPVPELVAQDLRTNLFLSRLPGHGRNTQAMAEPQVSDYLHAAVDAYEIGRRLGDKVILLGSSTGGTLATWLATFVQDLAAVILLSPNFDPKDPMAKLLLLPGGSKIARLIEGQFHEWEPQNEKQAIYWTSRYPVSALVPMMQLVAGIKRLDLST